MERRHAKIVQAVPLAIMMKKMAPPAALHASLASTKKETEPLQSAKHAKPENIQLEVRVNALSVHQEVAQMTQRQAARLVSQVKFPSIKRAPSAKRGHTHRSEMPRARRAAVPGNIAKS